MYMPMQCLWHIVSEMLLWTQGGYPSGSAAGGGIFGGATEDNSASLRSAAGAVPNTAVLGDKALVAKMIPLDSLVSSSSSSLRSMHEKVSHF